LPLTYSDNYEHRRLDNLSVDKYLASLQDSIVNLDFDAVVKAAQEAMAIVGDKFDSGEYFLSELVVAAEVMKEGLKVINPYLKGEAEQKMGKVVIATVEGDHHDLGKNIVGSLLGVQGFQVIDLGIDVSTARIIEAVKEHRPAIVGLSALLSMTMARMGDVIAALKEEGLRDEVKVIVGGTPLTDEYAEIIGADHRAVNALEGAKKCVEWVTHPERRS
jgi:methylmalonyl-CoA mutase cobalamin-binding domain/chain